MAPAPTYTLGAPGLSKTAEPCSAARQLFARGPAGAPGLGGGHGVPGRDPGALRADRPRAGRGGFLWAPWLSARCWQRSRRSASRSEPARKLPAPSRLSPPPARRGCQHRPPLLLGPGQWGAAAGGGPFPPPRRAPAPCGEGGAGTRLSQSSPALVAVHTGTKRLNG